MITLGRFSPERWLAGKEAKRVAVGTEHDPVLGFGLVIGQHGPQLLGASHIPVEV